jgi:flavin-dependent dehydrogenase
MSTETAVVVGGGPAGCAAHWALARAGIASTLLERGPPGRDKACGDALVPPAVALLADLGVDAPSLDALGGCRFRAIDLRAGQRLIWRLNLQDNGYVVRRAALDQALRDAVAGGAVYGAYVTSVDRDGDGWVVSAGHAGTFRARAVVLACGAGPRLPARWGVDGAPLASTSMSTYLDTAPPAHITFDFFDASRPGYGWVFPAGAGQVNAGVCRLGAPRGGLRQMAEGYLADYEAAGSRRWRGGRGPCWSGRGQCWHQEGGLVSCGDAAGLIDPISGEGITAALQSGQWAGEAVGAFLHGGGRDTTPLRGYSERLSAHFVPTYRSTPLRRVWRGLCGL